MADANQTFKTITVRFPEEFWDRAKIAAHQQRVSLQHACVSGIATFLGIDPPADEAPESTEAA